MYGTLLMTNALLLTFHRVSTEYSWAGDILLFQQFLIMLSQAAIPLANNNLLAFRAPRYYIDKDIKVVDIALSPAVPTDHIKIQCLFLPGDDVPRKLTFWHFCAL